MCVLCSVSFANLRAQHKLGGGWGVKFRRRIFLTFSHTRNHYSGIIFVQKWVSARKARSCILPRLYLEDIQAYHSPPSPPQLVYRRCEFVHQRNTTRGFCPRCHNAQLHVDLRLRLMEVIAHSRRLDNNFRRYERDAIRKRGWSRCWPALPSCPMPHLTPRFCS